MNFENGESQSFAFNFIDYAPTTITTAHAAHAVNDTNATVITVIDNRKKKKKKRLNSKDDCELEIFQSVNTESVIFENGLTIKKKVIMSTRQREIFKEETDYSARADADDDEEYDEVKGKYEGGLKMWERAKDLGDYSRENKKSAMFVKDEKYDIVKGKYEGGLKMWECAKDLGDYLCENKKSAMVMKERVLELGCGHGVPAICACLLYAETKTRTIEEEEEEEDNNNNKKNKKNSFWCVFQDYNEEVLKEVTIPNVRLNGIDEDQCEFFAGDWEDLLPSSSEEEPLLKANDFDLILSSDTIYNTEDAKKLAKLIYNCLKINRENTEETIDKGPICLLAQKRYYFGVGGSTATFMKICFDLYADKLRCDVVKEIADGASNVREIIRLVKLA